jgi:hypothetical protein
MCSRQLCSGCTIEHPSHLSMRAAGTHISGDRSRLGGGLPGSPIFARCSSCVGNPVHQFVCSCQHDSRTAASPVPIAPTAGGNLSRPLSKSVPALFLPIASRVVDSFSAGRPQPSFPHA